VAARRENRPLRRRLRLNVRLENGFPCPKCGLIFEADDGALKQFFEADVACSSCSKALSLWDVAQHQIEDTFVANGAHYVLLGCVFVAGEIKPVANRRIQVDLRPEVGDGQLLHVEYLSIGNHPVTVAEVRNPVYSIPPTIRPLLDIITRADFGGFKGTKLQVSFSYARRHVLDSTSGRLLLDAFIFYRDGSFDRMVVSANTCVEMLVSRYLHSKLISNGVSKKRVEPFLKQAATYSYQLNILLPLIHRLHPEIPALEGDVLQLLDELRQLRNNVVHEGATVGASARPQLRKMLAAAYIAYKYFGFYGSDGSGAGATLGASLTVRNM
jgi:hypothetical protein